MCEYCGCRQNPMIGQLMDEHDELLSLLDHIRRELTTADPDVLVAELRRFAELLSAHTHLEEDGVFAAMTTAGEFVETIEELIAEHRDLDAALSQLDLASPALRAQLDRMAADLAEHIDKENNGIFPATVVSLHPAEWLIVERAHGHHGHDHRDHDHRDHDHRDHDHREGYEHRH